MLVRKRDGVPDSRRLLQIPVFIGLEQDYRAVDRGVRRIHVAEDLRPRRLHQFFVPVDVQFRALLLPLIPVEDAQRDADTEADRLVRKRVVERRVVRIPRAQGRIG